MVTTLYHAGFLEIRDPDIHYGRKNADFGQGFYTTRDGEFAKRWARLRRGEGTYVNTYELDTAGLNVLSFDRNEDWFSYIFDNRHGKNDGLAEYDVIQGPVANDIIYDTMGIITSGFLSREEALKLLTIGPCYNQTVIKTDKARSQLTWKASQILSEEEVLAARAIVEKEEAEYQTLIAEALE